MANTFQPEDRLESWKEIAFYLKRDVRTVQRWENQSGLPIRRLRIDKSATVYAYKSELDVWWEQRQPQLQVDSADETPTPEPHRKGFVLSLVLGAVLIAALVLVLGLNTGGMRDRLVGKSARPRIQSLAVLPLQNLSPDPVQEYFSDGMTDALITDLAQIGFLKVISRTSVMHYKRTDKTLPEIARELNVDAIIEGTVQRSGDRVRITAQLIQGPSDKHLWANSYDRELRDILKLQGDVAHDIAEGISANLAGLPGRHPVSSYALNVEAYDDYLKGRNYVRRLTQADVVKGIEFLDRSIQRDPNYAPAYVELSFAYQVLAWYNHFPPGEVLPKAKATATRALSLDEGLAEAHSMLGLIHGGYEWDWAAEEKELRRGIELDSNSSFGHFAYALYLVTVGRKPDAIREINTTLELDPFSPIQLSFASGIFCAAGQYEAAIRKARRAVEIDPSFADGHLSLSGALEANGDFDEGFEEWLRYLRLDGDAELAQQLESVATKASGPVDAAHIALSYYQRKSKTQYVAALTMALAYLGVGDKDKTFEWLNKAYQEHSNMLSAVTVNPSFDTLRGEPRFQDLLRRMKLPVDSASRK